MNKIPFQVSGAIKVNAFKNEEKPMQLPSSFGLQPIERVVHEAVMCPIWETQDNPPSPTDSDGQLMKTE